MKDLDEDHKQLLENADSTEEWIVDYLNLVFGVGEESSDFWESVLIPRAAEKFNYSEKMIKEVELNYNALYFAVIYHTGITVQNEESIFSKFQSKSDKKGAEEPFYDV